MPGNPLPPSSLLPSASLADFASATSSEAAGLTAAASPAQLVSAAIQLLLFVCPLCFRDVTFSRDPLADVSWTILVLDTFRFTSLKKPDRVPIHQGQVFQIQNYFTITSFVSENCFHLVDLLCVHSTRKREDHRCVR